MPPAAGGGLGGPGEAGGAGDRSRGGGQRCHLALPPQSCRWSRGHDHLRRRTGLRAGGAGPRPRARLWGGISHCTRSGLVTRHLSGALRGSGDGRCGCFQASGKQKRRTRHPPLSSPNDQPSTESSHARVLRGTRRMLIPRPFPEHTKGPGPGTGAGRAVAASAGAVSGGAAGLPHCCAPRRLPSTRVDQRVLPDPVRRGSDLNVKKKAKLHLQGERGKGFIEILKG